MNAEQDIEILPPDTVGEALNTAKSIGTASPQNKAQRFRSQIAEADAQFFESLPQVIDKTIEKALEGKGHDKLLMYIIDRCLGRPTEHQEISATAEWKSRVDEEKDKLKEQDPNELLREYNQTIGLSA